MALEFRTAFNMLATRQAQIRRRAKRRVSLRIAVPINDNSLLRVIIRLFFFVGPFRVKESSRLVLLVSTIFNTDSTVAMAPKAKHTGSSSKAVVPETQMGGSPI